MVVWVPQNCWYQHLYPQEESQLPPFFMGGSLRSTGRSDPGFFSSYCLCVGSQSVSDFACALWNQDLLHPFGFPVSKPHWPSSQTFWGLLGAEPLGWETFCRAWAPHSLGRNPVIVIVLLLGGHLSGGVGFDYTASLPLLPILLHPFFMSLAVENVFCQSSSGCSLW